MTIQPEGHSVCLPSSTCSGQRLPPITGLRLAVPGNVRWMCTNLAELDVAASGQHKREFDLVDDAGETFACSIIGLHAKAIKLQNNDKVVVYYAVGRRVGQSDAFVVYIFRDGFVAAIGRVDPPPTILDRVMTRTPDY